MYYRVSQIILYKLTNNPQNLNFKFNCLQLINYNKVILMFNNTLTFFLVKKVIKPVFFFLVLCFFSRILIIRGVCDLIMEKGSEIGLGSSEGFLYVFDKKNRKKPGIITRIKIRNKVQALY